ncbi:hypothetical protein E2K93_12445 [Thalassotalea sp. HSM 43]|uniref:hypothetical protein n=1 Tax=Thalassotalea sp. HSM 43 TaxID=2552945 RepID=UPI0010800AF6|nr:hypothetical protein [Thalassotalea sp. HSM 43]QBY05142.1 hypothetical protein E2K93_12445 [Thalassotalea sp. HSM 43]
MSGKDKRPKVSLQPAQATSIGNALPELADMTLSQIQYHINQYFLDTVTADKDSLNEFIKRTKATAK